MNVSHKSLKVNWKNSIKAVVVIVIFKFPEVFPSLNLRLVNFFFLQCSFVGIVEGKHRKHALGAILLDIVVLTANIGIGKLIIKCVAQQKEDIC